MMDSEARHHAYVTIEGTFESCVRTADDAALKQLSTDSVQGIRAASAQLAMMLGRAAPWPDAVEAGSRAKLELGIAIMIEDHIASDARFSPWGVSGYSFDEARRTASASAVQNNYESVAPMAEDGVIAKIMAQSGSTDTTLKSSLEMLVNSYFAAAQSLCDNLTRGADVLGRQQDVASASCMTFAVKQALVVMGEA
jgi:hypothetical protein